MSSDVIDPKEKLLLEYMIADKEVFVKSVRIISSEFFEPPLNRVVDMLIEHFQKHLSIPSTEIIYAETGVELEKRTFEQGEMSYFLEEFEEHCRQQAMTNAILSSVDLIQEGNLHSVEDLVRKALTVRLDDSVGINLTDDVKKRIENTELNVDQRPTGIDAYDEIIGQTRRGEFNLVYAVSSGGKSIFLANIAYYMAKQGLNCCVISLELNEELYSKRLDSIVTDHSITKHRGVADEIAREYERLMGEGFSNITTKKMRYGTTPSEIRAYLMEYHLHYGCYPDVLIVDYMHLMKPDRSGKNDGKFEQHEDIAFSLREIMNDIDCYGFSAGQLNREGQDIIQVNSSHVAGGISVVSASDSSVALVASEEDIDNNQIQMVQLKIRNNKKFTKPKVIYRDPETLRITSTPLTGKKLSSPAAKESKAESVSSAKGKDKLKKALKLG